jgi:hypothetical protein
MSDTIKSLAALAALLIRTGLGLAVWAVGMLVSLLVLPLALAMDLLWLVHALMNALADWLIRLSHRIAGARKD